ncbi:MAG: SDR family NAD(P)-dependent oxidoreductase [Pseudonocardiales bacterium]
MTARALILAACDGLAWVLALTAASWLRYSGDVSRMAPGQVIEIIALAVVLHTGFGMLSHWYRGRHLVGSIDDAIHIAGVTAATGLVLFVIGLTAVIAAPRSVPIIAMLVALPLLLGPRIALRLSRDYRDRPDAGSAEQVIVFGAGRGGQQIIRAMLSDAESGYLPVALLDDDPAAQGHRISGVVVRGTRANIAEVAGDTRADLLVVAVQNLDPEVLREISLAARQAGLRVKVIPALTDLFQPWIGISDLRDLDIADLIGRRPVEVDVTAIAGYLAGKKVLVTGAGGSIGSELCRQVLHYGPSELLMLDRDESALHALQLSIRGRALLDTPDVILADIRDAATITRLFTELRPDVVFHAAALKHLPMLEQHPHEAWQSNVVGTANVLGAALESGVGRFVNVSTDKAANPVSVLGYSKRIGERLVAAAAGEASHGTYLSVRFGNVIGSRGSVLTTFTEQIATDAPLTVTHPEVTRFFMTIPEAVRLVIQAAAIGRPGEALVLDMGAPVRIVDIAMQLTALAGRAPQILYTGLRDGEKLHEELFGDGEADVRPVHPAVSHVVVPGLDPALVRRHVPPDAAAEVMARLATVDGSRDSSAGLSNGRAGPSRRSPVNGQVVALPNVVFPTATGPALGES